MNDKWGGEGGFPNYGEDVDPLARYYLDRTDILARIGDETYYPSRADLRTSVGEGFYILSGSFVKYLVEKTGIEKFLQIYNAPNMPEGLKTVTHKPLEEWKIEWIGYVASLR